MFCLGARQPCLLVVFISVCHASMWLARSCNATKPKIPRTSSQLPRGFCCAARSRGSAAKLIMSSSERSSLHRAMPDPDSLFDRPLIAMVGTSEVLVRLCSKLALEWRSSMSLPCFFLWLEFKVTAGPGLRSLGSPPLPPRLLARSNDVTYVQVDSIVLWAVVLPGGSCDSSRNTTIVYV